jgi:tetratricopeptide (TPR) repeat protein
MLVNLFILQLKELRSYLGLSGENTRANTLKGLGNEAFSKGSFQDAIIHYTAAIALDPNNKLLFSNRSVAYWRMKQFEDALADAEHCIKLDIAWGKGYTRRACALDGMGQEQAAVASLAMGLHLDKSLEHDKPILEKFKLPVEITVVQSSAQLEKALQVSPEGTTIIVEKGTYEISSMVSRSLQVIGKESVIVKDKIGFMPTTLLINGGRCI